MDNRSALRSKNPLSATRAASASYSLQQQSLRRPPPPPSRLGDGRSATQPLPGAHVVDLDLADGSNASVFVPANDALCASPDIIEIDETGDDLDSDPERRPHKRLKTEDDAIPAAIAPHDADQITDTAHLKLPGSPLSPYVRLAVTAAKQRARQERRSKPVQASRKAHGLEPPSMATRLPPAKNVADFSPWNGHHPEDVLNETVIKNGYFDKAPGPNSPECLSAKPTIWPNLSQKNNMGLQTLSYLFTSVMEKRLALGRCTAPSTFKPPPRVTVTDTKREAWLRDLANPDIPIRKQSRTIPHGIRGKLLMEQCLGKGISMPRAVWLAKCVGANELRAFRRKGVSGASAATGETKWVREWTIHVEQFLEGVISMCGQPGWQPKMDYAVKLATSFYSEHLLERDHYLDWIVSSFADGSIDRMPIWIIFVQLYWKDITALVKRGRRLTEAALAALHNIVHQNAPVYASLELQLRKLVTMVALTNRGCLVLPRTWAKYHHLLASEPRMLQASYRPETPLTNIEKRNQRLGGPLSRTPQNTRCSLLRLYSMLDAILLDVNVDRIVTLALDIVPDSGHLVHALLDWAASVYRTGLSRVYLAGKLIMQLRNDGQNTDGAILDYLYRNLDTAVDTGKIHMVVAELVRTDTFSASRYMQWLITNGLISTGKKPDLATGLLSALPPDALPLHLRNTQQTLLRRLSHVALEEEAAVRLAEEMVNALVDPNANFSMHLTRLEALNYWAQSAIYRRVLARVKVSITDGLFSLQSFCRLRRIAERLNDILAVADLIEMGLMSDEASFLATAIDTLDMHAECFAATGHLPALTKLAVFRYRLLRSQQALDRLLILALKAYLTRLCSKSQLFQLLDGDLAICQQQINVAVCSPASDNLISMHASTLESDNDIDAVFASGNAMDERLMQRVFARVSQRATKPGVPAVQSPSKLCTWWNQLRCVDTRGFTQLVRGYVQSCVADGNHGASFSNIVSSMIASTCVAFDTILRIVSLSRSPQIACTMLVMLVSDSVANTTLHDSEVYRYRVQQMHCQLECTEQITSVMVAAMDDSDFHKAIPGLSSLLLKYLAHGKQQVMKALLATEKASPTYLRNCGELMAAILRLNPANEIQPTKLHARDVIALANPLSVECCAAALHYLSETGCIRSPDDKAELQHEILLAIEGGCQVWPQLLQGAGPHISTSVYHWSRDKLLASMLDPHGSEPHAQEDLQRQLDIIDLTYPATKEDDRGQIIGVVTEKLKALETQFSAQGTKREQVSSGQHLVCSLNILLHLGILYAMSEISDSETSRQSLCQLLAALCSLLLHPLLQCHAGVLEYIYDVAASLTEILPDSILTSLIKHFPNAGKDTRIISLLGSTASPDAWLAIASQTAPPLGLHQQRLLSKQASAGPLQTPPASQNPAPCRQPPTASVQKAVSQRTLQTLPAGSEVPTKTAPFPLRRWEIMSDATPTVGENDTSLSLALFGARKV